jgi:hypothetical protein
MNGEFDDMGYESDDDGVKLNRWDLAAFRRHVRGLNKVLADIRGYCPEANFYLACDSLHVMSGQSHVGHTGEKACQKNSIVSESLFHSGGGDW